MEASVLEWWERNTELQKINFKVKDACDEDHIGR